jgi:hypothetical protein
MFVMKRGGVVADVVAAAGERSFSQAKQSGAENDT